MRKSALPAVAFSLDQYEDPFTNQFPVIPDPKVLPFLVLFVCAYPTSGWSEPSPRVQVEQPVSSDDAQTLESKLMGTWVLAEATTPGTPSGIGIRQKIFSPGRWEIVQRDPQTREIIFRHGGSYRLIGDLLEQKVEFATQKTRNYIGQVRRFRIKVENETYIQIGVGNPFNEVWHRPDGA